MPSCRKNKFNAMYKNKTTLLVSLFVAGLFLPLSAQHQYNPFGAGVIVGEPTGVTAKYWVSDTTAFDAAVGWSFEGRTSLHLHGSYLFHDFDLVEVAQGSLPLYAGIGGRLKARSGKSDRLGVRVPFGAAYHFEDFPLETFAEIVPILDVVPSSRVSLNAAIGARFYFE